MCPTRANKHPAYADDMIGETQKALGAIQTDPLHGRHDDDFISATVYGEKGIRPSDRNGY
jgi:hypothetical protein